MGNFRQRAYGDFFAYLVLQCVRCKFGAGRGWGCAGVPSDVAAPSASTERTAQRDIVLASNTPTPATDEQGCGREGLGREDQERD
jgi:hypothetical protein